MPFNGSGVFLRIMNWTNDAAAGIRIRADRHDDEDNNLAQGLTNCITRDGQSTPTADLPMGGRRHTNVGNATSSNQYASVAQIQAGSIFSAADTGAANAYAIAPTPSVAAYTSGQVFWIRIANTNTGASTINVSGLGVKNIKVGEADVAAGQLAAGQVYGVQYDGTDFQLIDSGPIVSASLSPSVQQSIFEPGDFTWSMRTSKTGWVLGDGRTIGNAASGATSRANADTILLFTELWNNTSSTVSGGRGASAAADFAANKTIVVPSVRGRGVVGRENMGGTAANVVQFSRNITTTNGSATATVNTADGLSIGMFLYSANITAGTTISAIVGTTLTLSTGVGVTAGTAVATRVSVFNDPNNLGATGGDQFLQNHIHGITDPGHSHTIANGFRTGAGGTAFGSSGGNMGTLAATDSATTGITINAAGIGNGQNIQPSIVMNGFYKL